LNSAANVTGVVVDDDLEAIDVRAARPDRAVTEPADGLTLPSTRVDSPVHAHLA